MNSSSTSYKALKSRNRLSWRSRRTHEVLELVEISCKLAISCCLFFTRFCRTLSSSSASSGPICLRSADCIFRLPMKRKTYAVTERSLYRLLHFSFDMMQWRPWAGGDGSCGTNSVAIAAAMNKGESGGSWNTGHWSGVVSHNGPCCHREEDFNNWNVVPWFNRSIGSNIGNYPAQSGPISSNYSCNELQLR